MADAPKDDIVAECLSMNHRPASVRAQIGRDAAAEIQRLRAVLEPFAEAAKTFDGVLVSQNPEDTYAFSGRSSKDGPVGAITVGDLRRARAAYRGEA